MNEEYVLGELGLNKKEARLYILLLQKGESSAVSIAKHAKLHRRTVYDVLDSLHKKGLVSIRIVQNVRNYAAQDPLILKEIQEEREKLLGEILPKLRETYSEKKSDVDVSIYEGPEAMMNLFRLILKTSPAEEICMIGAGLKAPKYFKHTFPRYVNELNDRKWRLIQPDVQWIREEMDGWNIPKDYRFLPEKYLSPMSLIASEDILIILLMEPLPLGIAIRGEAYARAFKNYFGILWDASFE